MYVLSSNITALGVQMQPQASTKPSFNNASSPHWARGVSRDVQECLGAQGVLVSHSPRWRHILQCLWNPGHARFPEEGEVYTSSRVGFCLCLRHGNVDVASDICTPLISAASGRGGAEVPDPVPWPDFQQTNRALGSLALGAWEGWGPLCQGSQVCGTLSHTLRFTNIINFSCNVGYKLAHRYMCI